MLLYQDTQPKTFCITQCNVFVWISWYTTIEYHYCSALIARALVAGGSAHVDIHVLRLAPNFSCLRTGRSAVGLCGQERKRLTQKTDICILYITSLRLYSTVQVVGHIGEVMSPSRLQCFIAFCVFGLKQQQQQQLLLYTEYVLYFVVSLY